jgi:hypothetical protein
MRNARWRTNELAQLDNCAALLQPQLRGAVTTRFRFMSARLKKAREMRYPVNFVKLSSEGEYHRPRFWHHCVPVEFDVVHYHFSIRGAQCLVRPLKGGKSAPKNDLGEGTRFDPGLTQSLSVNSGGGHCHASTGAALEGSGATRDCNGYSGNERAKRGRAAARCSGCYVRRTFSQ